MMSKQKQQTLGGLGDLGQLKITEEGMEVQKQNPAGKAAAPGNPLPNLGWAYWVAYFRFEDDEIGQIKETHTSGETKVEVPSRKSKNAVFLEASYNRYHSFAKLFQKVGTHDFKLTTTYPGLLAGSGYQHEISADSELKLGFFFDHTTGLPTIPGSSVKGVLRSAFEPERAAFLAWLASASKDEALRSIAVELSGKQRIKELRNRIFGYDTKDPAGSKAANNLPMYERDIFYDAVIVGSEHPFISKSNGGKGQFFGTDFITPHINRKNRKLDPFTNPIPIQFMKILPKVSFEFRFDLQDTRLSDGFVLKAAIKKELFKTILLHLGIGAKTNTGYGQFTE